MDVSSYFFWSNVEIITLETLLVKIKPDKKVTIVFFNVLRNIDPIIHCLPIWGRSIVQGIFLFPCSHVLVGATVFALFSFLAA